MRQKARYHIDNFLYLCATCFPSYLKHTTHFLQTLAERVPLSVDSWFVTLDMIQLYTNISNAAALAAAREALADFRLNPLAKPSNNANIRLLEFVLTKLMGNTTSTFQALAWAPRWPPAIPMSSWAGSRKTLSTPTRLNPYNCGNTLYMSASAFGQAPKMS